MRFANLYLQDNEFWDASRTLWLRGNVFLGDALLDKATLSSLFPRKMTHNEFMSILKKLNGFFGFVLRRDGTIYAAVDRLRSIPLFYGSRDGEVSISDDPYWIRQQMRDADVDRISAIELLLTGYVTGGDTLFPNVKQLKSGEVLIAESNKDISIVKYYHHTHENFFEISDEDLLSELDKLLESSFTRFLRIADGRTIVVPLSGGYDSRLIVLMLKKLGYTNVVTFSYGRSSNKESKISKKLANCVGVDWIFIEYNHELWRQWYRSEDWESYSKMAGNLTSVPLFQDWPAILEMKKQELIPIDSIFAPGHGDIFPGGIYRFWAKEETIRTYNDLIDLIYSSHYNLWELSDQKNLLRPKLETKIKNVMGNASIYNRETAAYAYERWVLEERTTKFIINGVRAYEFFGYQWWLPLCDSELVDFWLRVPLDKRRFKNLYKSYVKKLLLRLTNSEVEFMKKNPYSAMGIARSCFCRLPARLNGFHICRHLGQYLAYKDHPLAYNGIVPFEKYKILYTGIENRNSFLALDILADIANSSIEAGEAMASVSIRITETTFKEAPFSKYNLL